MDKKTSETATQAMKKIQKMIDDGELVTVSAEEAAALRQMLTLWNQIKAAVTLGGFIGGFVKWIVGLLAMWLAFKSDMFQLLTGTPK